VINISAMVSTNAQTVKPVFRLVGFAYAPSGL